MKRNKHALMVLLILTSSVLAACGGLGGASPAASIPVSAKLYPDTDENLLAEPVSGYIRTTHYLNGGSTTMLWHADASDESVAGTLRYSIVLASAGSTSVDLTVLLESGGEETVIAEETFTVDSDMYQPYRGEITLTDAAVTDGESITVRMVASGDDFGMFYGGLDTYFSVFAAPELADEVMDQRTAALDWMLENISVGEEGDVLSTDLFQNFTDQLDFVISRENNAKWVIGWGLTNDEMPYTLTWTDNMFAAEEITQDEAIELETEEMQVSFEVVTE